MSLAVDIAVAAGAFQLRATFAATQGITSLFGPSGAGKTLTLRALAGLARPTTGRIVLDGRMLFDSAERIDLPPRDRRIGYVFQHYALFPHLSVERNVAYGMIGLSREEASARSAELLGLVGLDGLDQRRPSELSGGQQQRVAIARALATHPALLLLDEPFAAVDFRLRRRLRDELRRIQQATSIPMLLVTHDFAEVRQLSDYLVLLDGGNVVRAGATADLTTPPIDAAVAELIQE